MRNRVQMAVAILIVTVICVGAAFSEEPSYEQALARWADTTRPIAFLGCKDHPDEFGVMWNGNLTLASPALIDGDLRMFKDRKDESLQVSFSFGDKPDFQGRDREDGSAEPSLAEGYLPMTQVKIRKNDVVLKQEAFVSSSDGTCLVGAWNDPVFLRVRFTVLEAGKGSSPIHLWAQFARNHTHYAMREVSNVRIQFVAPLYPRTLQQSGNALQDSRGLVLMASPQGFKFHQELPAALDSIAARESQLDRNVCEFTLQRSVGSSVELVLPFVATAPDKVAAVRPQGFPEAHQSVAKSWKSEISRGMQIEVPEEPLNNLWRFNVPLSFMTADSYPNGDHILKTASHGYEALWTTPNSINMVDLIRRGYFEEVAAYIAPLLDMSRQQAVPNTGVSFSSSRGFLGSPSDYMAINWVTDNGAALWAASEYYLMSRDEKFLARSLPAMLESLEWIARERGRTKLRGGSAAGLMPAGRFTDAENQANFFWNDAWTYRGLSSVCRVLDAIGHKDAARWAGERDEYRSMFRKTFAEQVQRTNRWQDKSGAWLQFIPFRLGQVAMEDPQYFYLDAGPMMLGVAGLIDPKDETMTWAMKWLTEGPNSAGDPDWQDWTRPASLRYEMSSLEPCYSWNIHLRFLRGEREKFLEGVYSLAAGSVTRRYLGGYEHRNGIQALPVTNSALDTHLRNMLVIEDEGGQGLELLRNSPSAWLRPEKRIRVDRAQTWFGPLNFRVTSSAARVEAEIETPARKAPQWIRIYLNHPEGKALRSVTVNGAPVAPAAANSVDIRNPAGTLKVVAEF
jgi:hypothetical protein